MLLAVAAGAIYADKRNGAESVPIVREVLARVNGVPVYRRDLDRRLVQERSNTEQLDDSENNPLSPAARRAAR